MQPSVCVQCFTERLTITKKSKFIRRSQLKLLTWVLLRRVAKHLETIGLLAESTVPLLIEINESLKSKYQSLALIFLFDKDLDVIVSL
jgi:hypothetical protein